VNRFVLTEKAEEDLNLIWEYIADQSAIEAADKVAQEIFAAITKLTEMPGMGHRRPDLTERPFRFWTVHSYAIVYEPESSPLEIVRILSWYRDLPKILE
jgi:plasmid stabilization system protein ParE